MQENTYTGNITIEGQRSIKVSGVTAVNGFSSVQITLTLVKTKMVITGSDLKISDFSKESGLFSAVGEIGGIKFSGGGKLKIFK